MPDERNLRRLRHAIPPQTDEIAVELEAGGRQLLHCLDCGRQLVALKHGGSCLFCSSEAVIIETW